LALVTRHTQLTALIVIFLLGVGSIGGYAIWEHVTDHPMTPPRLSTNRDFIGLNVGALLIYLGLAIMFFLLPFDLIDRRGLSPTSAGLAFLPFTLALGLLSPYFGSLADEHGARAMVTLGAAGASVTYLWMMLAHDRSFWLAVITPQAVLGISFAVLIAPLAASVLSSVPQPDEGLASGINNAAIHIAQLAGLAVAAGLGALTSGYRLGLAAAAAASAAGALVTAMVAVSHPMVMLQTSNSLTASIGAASASPRRPVWPAGSSKRKLCVRIGVPEGLTRS
jgi:MFS family permease